MFLLQPSLLSQDPFRKGVSLPDTGSKDQFWRHALTRKQERHGTLASPTQLLIQTRTRLAGRVNVMPLHTGPSALPGPSAGVDSPPRLGTQGLLGIHINEAAHP